MTANNIDKFRRMHQLICEGDIDAFIILHNKFPKNCKRARSLLLYDTIVHSRANIVLHILDYIQQYSLALFDTPYKRGDPYCDERRSEIQLTYSSILDIFVCGNDIHSIGGNDVILQHLFQAGFTQIDYDLLWRNHGDNINILTMLDDYLPDFTDGWNFSSLCYHKCWNCVTWLFKKYNNTIKIDHYAYSLLRQYSDTDEYKNLVKLLIEHPYFKTNENDSLTTNMLYISTQYDNHIALQLICDACYIDPNIKLKGYNGKFRGKLLDVFDDGEISPECANILRTYMRDWDASCLIKGTE